MKDGWYMLCPACGKIDDGTSWYEYWTTYSTMALEVNTEHEGTYPDVEYDEVGRTGEVSNIEHECGFFTSNYCAYDFIIRIKDNAIVDTGLYYKREPDKLRLLATRNSLRVDM